MAKDYHTTSEAARLLSVSPDTVLKWVKAGKIDSYRTPGGHARIPKEAVDALLPKAEPSPVESERSADRGSFKYCWDFHSEEGEVKTQCRECVAYRSRAHRCYEMINIPEQFGHLKLHCGNDCDACEYFQLMRGQSTNALIVTRSRHLLEALKTKAEESWLTIRFATSEYACASMIDKFRPDFVVIDCAFGMSRTRDICQHLLHDDRIPFARIILSSKRANAREYCNNEAFGWITKPFTMYQLESLIRGTVGQGMTA